MFELNFAPYSNFKKEEAKKVHPKSARNPSRIAFDFKNIKS